MAFAKKQECKINGFFGIRKGSTRFSKSGIPQKVPRRYDNHRQNSDFSPGGLHNYQIPNRFDAELLTENLQDPAFVKVKIMLHGGRIQFDKNDLIPDKHSFRPFRDRLTDQPLPGSNHIGFVEPGLQVIFF
jgi:hypothetical protein